MRHIFFIIFAIPATGFLTCPLVAMQKGTIPTIKEYKREQELYIPEEKEPEMQQAEFTPAEKIFFGETEEAEQLAPRQEALPEFSELQLEEQEETSGPFKAMESFTIQTSPEATPIRLMTSKTPEKGSSSTGFPQLYYEDTNLENIEDALRRGAPVHIHAPISPLRWAAYEGNIPLIRLLRRYGANPEERDMSGMSAFDVVRWGMYQQESGKPSGKDVLKALEEPIEFKAKKSSL